MKYAIRLNREQAVLCRACSQAPQLSPSFSALTSLKLSLYHYFHAGTSHVNLFKALLHFGRKYFYQNMRNNSCVLCLSVFGLIYKANGLTQCHAIIKPSYTYVNPQALLKVLRFSSSSHITKPQPHLWVSLFMCNFEPFKATEIPWNIYVAQCYSEQLVHCVTSLMNIFNREKHCRDL